MSNIYAIKLKELKSQEYYELKSQLDEIHTMVKAIYEHLVSPQQNLTSAKVYQLKEKARKKALEIKEKLNIE